ISSSEPQVDREPEAPARRERRHVDVPADWLVAEVADLRIHSGVIRVRPQIASAETQLRAANSAGHPLYHRRRKLVRHRDLSKLEERRILDVHRGLLRKEPQAVRALGRLHAPIRDRVRIVGRVLTQIVEELGQVDDAAAILPVQQSVDVEVAEPEGVDEGHREIGIGITNLAHDRRPVGKTVVAYYLSRRRTLLELE